MAQAKSPTKKTGGKKPTKQELEELEKQRIQEEEAERLRQLEEEKSRGPRSFQDEEFVEQCIEKEDIESLLQYLSKEMRLENYEVNLRNNVLLDFYIYNVEYVLIFASNKI